MRSEIRGSTSGAPSLRAYHQFFSPIEDDVPERAPTERAAPAAPRPKTNRPRALVIDDVADVGEMLGVLLEGSGFEVTVRASAYEALDAVTGGAPFDVIISDLGMPGMSGYELAAGLRRMPAYRSVPLIAITGFTGYDDRERALSSGFNAFLMKPIDPHSLVKLIENLTD